MSDEDQGYNLFPIAALVGKERMEKDGWSQAHVYFHRGRKLFVVRSEVLKSGELVYIEQVS